MRVLVLSPIDDRALERLRRSHDVTCAIDVPPPDLPALFRQAQVAVFRSGTRVTAELIDQAPDLRLLIRAGAGLDNVDVEHARRRGVDLHHFPGAGARAVAELTFGLMLALARKIVLADQLLRQGRWAKPDLGGSLLEGKTIGIVGAGNIGSRVGEMGMAWGMQALGIVKPLTPDAADSLRRRGIRPAEFDEVVAAADFLTIHVPLTAATRHIVNADVLAKVKPGAYLVNVARGGVVDEEALYEALIAGDRLRGAALDVHADERDGKIPPFADLPNVVLTPHIGSMAAETQSKIGDRIVSVIAELDETGAAPAQTQAPRIAAQTPDSMEPPDDR